MKLTLPDAPVTLSVLFRRNEVWIKDTELYEPEPEQQQVEREQQEEEEEEVDPVPEEEAPVDPVPEEVAPVDPVPEEEAPVDPIPEPGEEYTQRHDHHRGACCSMKYTAACCTY